MTQNADNKGLVIGQTYTKDEVKAMLGGEEDGVVYIGWDDEDEDTGIPDRDEDYEPLKASKTSIYLAVMEGVFGESITAVGATPKQAVAALRQEFLRGRDARRIVRGDCPWFSFPEAAGYFAVSVQKMRMGTAVTYGWGDYLDAEDFIPGMEQ